MIFVIQCKDIKEKITMEDLKRNEKDFKRIVSRLKGRNLPLYIAMQFNTPEHLSYLNTAIKSLEVRKGKKYSVKDYNKIINKFSKNKEFLDNCNIYDDNNEVCTKPTITFINDISKGKYKIENLKPSLLKNKEFYKTKSVQVDELYTLYQRMKNAPSYDFLSQFKDVDKLKFLISEIKNKNLSVEDKEKYLLEFYNYKAFNSMYYKYLDNKNNKYLKPSLTYKTPLNRGGEDTLENIYFITKLESNAKSNMTMIEWNKIKRNIKHFISDI